MTQEKQEQEIIEDQTKESIVILLLGQRNVGKDTVATMLNAYGFKRVAFADSLKEEYSKNNNVPVEDLHDRLKKEVHRSGLISLGESMRSVDRNYWINSALDPYLDRINADTFSLKEGERIVISDCRRDSEIEFAIKRKFLSQDLLKNERWIIVKIERSLNRDNDVRTHNAEGYIAGADFISQYYNQGYLLDHTVKNNGSFDDLGFEVSFMMDQLKIERK